MMYWVGVVSLFLLLDLFRVLLV